MGHRAVTRPAPPGPGRGPVTGSAATSAAERAAELRKELEHHNRLYYVQDEPQISDADYDALLNELRDIEAENPDLIMPESPTQRVGAAPLSKFEPARHPQRMLSLANARNEEELLAWARPPPTRLAREADRVGLDYGKGPKTAAPPIPLFSRAGVLER